MPLSGLPSPNHPSKRAALVILDVFSSYTFPGGAALLRAVSARAEALRAACDRARRARVPVVFVNDGLGHWDSNFPALLEQCAATSRRVSDLVSLLRPERGDYVLLKPRHSGFYGTPLEALLEHLRVSVLTLAGTSAESCVLATACDAHTRGFHLVVPADTLVGPDQRSIRRTLQVLSGTFAARTPASARSLRWVRGRLASGDTRGVKG